VLNQREMTLFGYQPERGDGNSGLLVGENAVVRRMAHVG